MHQHDHSTAAAQVATQAPGSADAPSGGQALPAATRLKMERAFGVDFADVRVHEGPEAAALGAQAFARGSHLYFAPGRYDPETPAGQALLGHELAHVVQQRAGRVASGESAAGGAAINADPGLEQEANQAGHRAAAGLPAGLSGGGGGAPDGAAAAVAQRAVGFEFEMSTWRSYDAKTHDRLAKSTVIHDGDGFNLEADDQDGDIPASDVEVVIDPPVTTLPDLRRAVGGAAKLVSELVKSPGKEIRIGDKLVCPGAKAEPSVQATVAVPMKRIPELFRAVGDVNNDNLESDKTSTKASVDLVDRRLRELDHEASLELRGLLVVIVDYLLEAKYAPDQADWPKGLYPIMARTCFTKMFELMPEYAYFSKPKHVEEFVKLVCDVAGVERDAPVCKQQFREIDRGPGDDDGGRDIGQARLTTTVEDWLSEMPDRDRLSFSHDRNFEGMGRLGGKTDRRVSSRPSKDQPIDPSDGKMELSIEEVSSKAAQRGSELIRKKVSKELRRVSSDEETTDETNDETNDETTDEDTGKDRKGKSIDRASPREKRRGKQRKTLEGSIDETAKDDEAPVFELRNLARPGGPEQWVDYAVKVFLEVDRVNEGETFQGPTKKRDPDKEEPEGVLSGDFIPDDSKPERKVVNLGAVNMEDLDVNEGSRRPQRRSFWRKLCCFCGGDD